MISIGNFDECKGHRYAFEALKKLKEKYDISFMLISGGTLKHQYESIIKDYEINVKLVDRCSQEELKGRGNAKGDIRSYGHEITSDYI